MLASKDRIVDSIALGDSKLTSLQSGIHNVANLFDLHLWEST